MKKIRQEDLKDLNGLVLNLPSFRHLKSKENIKEVFDEFLKQIYIEQPKEILDMFDFQLNKKLQETFYLNFGISKNYSSKIKGYLKNDVAINLERLFQQKGSKDLFKIYADIFENIFKRLNFYTIKVYKIPDGTDFIFKYKLEPLYITDESVLITEPEIDITKTRKYIMELDNFKDFTCWPMSTDLVYLQFSAGIDIINNHRTFLNGVRAYASTLLQGNNFQYSNTSSHIENIDGGDIELILLYFQLETIISKNPNYDLQNINGPVTFLSHFENSHQWRDTKNEFLASLQELILDYSNAKYQDLNEMEGLKRRWQMFLRKQERDNNTFNNIDELRDLISSRYPYLYLDFNEALYGTNPLNSETVLEVYTKLYGLFLNNVINLQRQDDPNVAPNYYWEWVLLYIEVIFDNLYMSKEFVKEYLDPVMDLFMKYFFPVEMDYIDNLLFHVKIKDNWNAVATAARYNRLIHRTVYDLQTPIRGLDRVVITLQPKKWHSYIDKIDKFTVSDL